MRRLIGAIREPLQGFMGLPIREVYLVARDKAMFETMYGCGLRVSEACGMNWRDIDWAARELRVLGKGSKLRIVPLGQYAIDALLTFSRHYEERFQRKAEGHQPVFISAQNRRINQRSICRVIEKWAKAAGITRHINPHAFRHSCAQHMLDAGADLRAVQTLLGHARIQTTEIYTSVSTRKLKAIHGVTHPRA
jgi:site-specific recombinase XerD